MATQNKKNPSLAFRMFYTSLFRKLIWKYILKDGSWSGYLLCLLKLGKKYKGLKNIFSGIQGNIKWI